VASFHQVSRKTQAFAFLLIISDKIYRYKVTVTILHSQKLFTSPFTLLNVKHVEKYLY